jgi:hypothetical protein
LHKPLLVDGIQDGAPRSVSRRALLREKNFDDHRADGYQSS